MDAGVLRRLTERLSAPQAMSVVSRVFHVEGTADLNGDGRSDIIFRDPDGIIIDWLMNGASIQAIQNIGATPSQDFSLAPHHFDLI